MSSRRYDYTADAIQARQLKVLRALRSVDSFQTVQDLIAYPALCQQSVANYRATISRLALAAWSMPTEDLETLYLLTIVHPEWSVGEGGLGGVRFRQIRDWLHQRLFKHEGLAFLGVIDLTWFTGGKGQVPFWQPHVHAVVRVKVGHGENPTRRLRRIFRAPRDKARGVYVPVKVQGLTDLPGAIEYCTKGLLIDGPLQRSTWRSRKTNRRLSSIVRLPNKALKDLAMTLMTLRLEDRVVMHGLAEEFRPRLGISGFSRSNDAR
jgi:hypothetical protein